MPPLPSGVPDDGVIAELYGYARLVTLDAAVAADAVRDTIVVVVARDIPPDDRLVLLALARNEALRQLRARQRFVDVRGDVDLRGLAAGATGEELWRRALGGLAPGDRDALALAHRVGIGSADIGAVMRVRSSEAAARVRGAESAWATVASAVGAVVATADEPPPCSDVVTILTRHASPTDPVDDAGSVVSLAPVLVARLARHVERCDACRDRRKADLGTSPVTGLLSADDRTPADLRQGAVTLIRVEPERVERVASRAGALARDGFPEPLDAHDRAPGVWVRRAVVLAGTSAVLLLLAMLLSLTIR